MKKFFYIFIIIGIFFAQNYASSKKFVIRNWSIEEGLRSNQIIKIESDKDGFIWLATDNGLTQFDGFRFTNYTKQNTPVIKNNIIKDIFKDTKGNILFLANNNNLIKIAGYSFHIVFPDTLLAKDRAFKKVFCFNDSLWVSAYNGLFLLVDNKVIPRNNFYGIPANQISAFTVNKQNELWIAVKNKGILKYENGNFIQKFSNSELKNKIIRKIFFDSQGRIWVSYKNGIIVLKNGLPVNSGITRNFSNKILRRIAEDKYGNIWIATKRSGLYHLDKNNNITTITEKNGLSDDSITDIKIIDENIWVSTLSAGLNLINYTKLRVLDTENGLTSLYVNSFYQDYDNSVLIGTNKGIFRTNKNFTSVKKLDFLKEKHIYAIKRDKKGNLLIGTRLFGLFIISPNGKIIANYNLENKLGGQFVRAVFVDYNNTIYVGTNVGGITIISDTTFKYITKKDGLSNDLIAFIHKAKDGKLWVGTSGGGINIISGNKVENIINTANDLKGNIISSIYEDEDSTIWVSVNGGGISHITKNGIENFTVKDGLFSDRLLNIQCNDKNTFWFTTYYGIFSVEKENFDKYLAGKINSINYNFYGKADGMPTERCIGASPQSAIIFDNKILFASTSFGAVVINTANITPAKSKTKVVIDKITVNDNTVNRNNNIELPGHARKIEFGFSVINFRIPFYQKVYYRLSNIDSEWREAGENRTVAYSYLPSGKYSFEIKSGNIYNNKSTEHAQINFTILKVFWETWWFYALVLLTIIGIVYTIMNYRLKNIIRLEKLRSKISADLHDELGSGLSEVSILSDLLKTNKNLDTKTINGLEQIGNSTRYLIGKLSDIIWIVNPHKETFKDIIVRIQNTYQEIFYNSDIRFNITSMEILDNIKLPIEIKQNLYLVIKEAINNALKYSKAKNIALDFRRIDKKFFISIIDDGIGFDIDKKHQGNGLNNIKNRIESINGTVKIDSNNNGTKIKITIEI